jgi:hypothetical protein
MCFSRVQKTTLIEVYGLDKMNDRNNLLPPCRAFSKPIAGISPVVE